MRCVKLIGASPFCIETHFELNLLFEFILPFQSKFPFGFESKLFKPSNYLPCTNFPPKFNASSRQMIISFSRLKRLPTQRQYSSGVEC